jgi:hypothetical protein
MRIYPGKAAEAVKGLGEWWARIVRAGAAKGSGGHRDSGPGLLVGKQSAAICWKGGLVDGDQEQAACQSRISSTARL